LTNIISLTSIILLLYWVFIFISVQVFDLKIFRENTTEIFSFSILGILSLLAGAVIVNVMFNLTKISDVVSGEYKNKESENRSLRKIIIYLFIASFPVIFGLLFLGDYFSSADKEKKLVETAEYIIKENENEINKFCSLKFDSVSVNDAGDFLKIVSGEFNEFPSISFVYMINKNGRNIFVNIQENTNWFSSSKIEDHIFSCSKEENEYLKNVFIKEYHNHKFIKENSNYRLYFPYKKGKDLFVIYFSDYQRYGKIGS
ncbi:MAG: hypothetical protein GXX85_15915, partial [Ignavibacteria bacterium]|nr:hypothetical protein [Ignavibacteria bacterium]